MSGNEGVAPENAQEEARLARLNELQILNTPKEVAFDRLTRTAAHLLEAPIAFITLVDRDRQWMKSTVGADLAETPRKVAFCDYTIRKTTSLIVLDATQDPHFQNNPLVVGPPGIRFYCGAPLLTPDGFGLGSLCVIDTVARERPSDETVACLEDLAATAMELMRMRQSISTNRTDSIHHDTGRLREFFRRLPAMTLTLTPGWLIMEASDRFCQELKRDRTGVLGRPILAFMTPDFEQHVRELLTGRFVTDKEFLDEPVQLKLATGDALSAKMSARAIPGADGGVSQILVAFVPL